MSQRNSEPAKAVESIVSLTSSVSWQSAIGRELMSPGQPRVHRACLDFQQLNVLAKQSRPTVAIIEVYEKNVAQCIRFAAGHLQVDGLIVIGVGDWASASVRHELSRLGMTAFYRSFLDFERLAKCVERFFENVSVGDATIEQRVETSLPWAACSTVAK